jgi:hypothetical protein
VKRPARLVLVVVLLVAGLAAIPSVRNRVLAAIGGALVLDEAGQPGDVLVLSESGDAIEFQAAEIDAADAFARQQFAQVLIVRASPTVVGEELERRGVKIEDPVIATLRQLGIPPDRVALLDAGEGGTTESTAALASWVRDRPCRMLVIIGAAHSRRYHRALVRAWPDGVPRPRVSYPRRTLFRADSWWTSRRSLREGILEFEKLVWDYLTHPL